MITYSILLLAFTGALCFKVHGHLDGHSEGVIGSTAPSGEIARLVHSVRGRKGYGINHVAKQIHEENMTIHSGILDNK